jgi:hypothetical protein
MDHSTEDSFDNGIVALAVQFADESPLTNSTPAFRQAVKVINESCCWGQHK